jgi:hypothetical protein
VAATTVGMASAWSRRQHSDHGADKGAPHGFDFSNLSKTGSNWKLKKNALCCSKNSQILHAARFGIVNNFHNCADIQFSIDIELKLLEQIHNLNF